MDPKLIVKALDALIAGDEEDCMSILKGLIANAAGAEADADGEGDPAAAGEDPNAQMASDPEGTPEEPQRESAEPPEDHREPPMDDEENPESSEPGQKPKKPSKASKESMSSVVAGGTKIMRLTGTSTFAEAADRVEAYKKSHIELESGRAALAKERAVLESAERRKLCTELVTLGAEFPATVWADDKSTTLKTRWLSMPIKSLRAHASEQRTARKGQRTPTPAPAGGPGDVSVTALSAADLKICTDMGCDPAEYVKLKAFRDMGNTGFLQANQVRENQVLLAAAAARSGGK